jgi:hypothetical protein
MKDVKLNPPEGFPGIVNSVHVIGVCKRSQLTKETLENDYSPCPYSLEQLEKMLKLVRAFEEYTAEGSFNILVPKNKCGPLIVEVKNAEQLYLIAPQKRPYLSDDVGDDEE